MLKSLTSRLKQYLTKVYVTLMCVNAPQKSYHDHMIQHHNHLKKIIIHIGNFSMLHFTHLPQWWFWLLEVLTNDATSKVDLKVPFGFSNFYIPLANIAVVTTK